MDIRRESETSTLRDAGLISVCICTYRRPALLHRLLEKLKEQITDGQFSISVVVVDNDAAGSGRDAVLAAGKHSTIPVEYHVEPKRNISLARNRSVENAKGGLIAFIDDDEFPEKDWLFNHRKTLLTTGANGVLGPVLPHFDGRPPKWLLGSGLLDRRSFATRQLLDNARDTRTGNVLLWRSLFSDKEDRFDPRFGRTGGGDAVFFKRMMEKGKTFVWCNEAVVFETIPPERQKRMYHVKRAFTRGITEARESAFLSLSTLRSIAATVLYTLILPFSLLLGQHVFMRILVKGCDHFSKILAHLGIEPVRERPYGESRKGSKAAKGSL